MDQKQEPVQEWNFSETVSADDPTGVMNRRAGMKAFEDIVEQAAKEKERVVLCLFHVNGLKEINESFGHREGDKLLRWSVRLVKQELDPEDVIFRISGNEFVCIFRHTDMTSVRERVDRAKAALEQSFFLGKEEIQTGFCYGLAEIPPGRRPAFEEIYIIADERLYEQKRAFHIRQAEKRLEKKPNSCGEEKEFSYDEKDLYQALTCSTDEYLYICNMKTGIFRYPKAMVEEFGLPCEVIENATAVWGAKVHEDDKAAFMEANQDIMEGRSDEHCVEYRAKNRRGEWVWLRCRGHLTRDENGEPNLFAGFITNLGKKDRIDHLTGLFNRLEFELEINRLFGLEEPHGFVVMLFGIDNLKRINRLHDRQFGDEVIRIISQKMQTFLPTGARLYRLDGDEFGVILRGAERNTSTAYYHRLQDMLSQPQSYKNRKYLCTLSCGCVQAWKDGSDYRELVRNGTYALEFAKRNGKNQICIFTENVLRYQERSLKLTELLRESVEKKMEGFELYYQPVVSVNGKSPGGAEALARWRCSEYGEVSPVEFIPLLEESGLIHKAGRWIFEEAVRTCKRWTQIVPEFKMGINLSNLQLEDPELVAFIRGVLKTYQVAPEHIVAEITESCLASNLERFRHVLQDFREMGIWVSMDDFGTGYSSLGILKQAPFNVVKIDRTFVEGIQENSFDRIFVSSMVKLCHDIGIYVCLEGIETEAEKNLLAPLDLDYCQGYYFGHPVPQSQYEQELL